MYNKFKLNDIVKFNPYLMNANVDEFEKFTKHYLYLYDINDIYKIVDIQKNYDDTLYILQNTKTDIIIDSPVAEWELIKA